MEEELKLSFHDTAALKALQEHARLKGRLKPAKQLEAIYYDTAEFALLQQQVGLRIRREGKQWLQTLKAKGKVSAGLHQRLEWEMPIAKGALDIDSMLKAVAQDADIAKLLEQVRNELVPCFEVKLARRTADIEFENSLVEVALDEGEILAEGQIAVVREIELELKLGNTQALFGLARDLAKDVLLLPEAASKAQRGYALLAGTPKLSSKPAIKKHAALHQRVEQALAHCINQMAAATTAFITEEEAGEALHQLRVATRRLRSALKTFEEKAPPPAEVKQDLKWLTAALGMARDWEVLDTQTAMSLQERLCREMDSERLDGLLQSVRDAAAASRKQARAVAANPRMGALLLGLQSWLPSLASNPELQLPADEGLARLLKGLRRKLLKRSKAVGKNDARQLHSLRIAGKESRYTHELFADALPRRRNRRYIAKLVRMQDELGHMNDLSVARGLLGQITDAKSEAARQFVSGYLSAMTASPQKKGALKKRVAAVLKQPPPKP